MSKIKQTLKKNHVIMKIWSKRTIYLRKIRKIRILYDYMINSPRNSSSGDRIRVGFLVQMPEIWDKQVDIYDECKHRDNIDTFLFVVPNTSLLSQTIENNYKNNYFLMKYSDAIRVFDENSNLINLKSYNLDYLFYPRPYDQHLPRKLRSK